MNARTSIPRRTNNSNNNFNFPQNPILSHPLNSNNYNNNNMNNIGQMNNNMNQINNNMGQMNNISVNMSVNNNMNNNMGNNMNNNMGNNMNQMINISNLNNMSFNNNMNNNSNVSNINMSVNMNNMSNNMNNFSFNNFNNQSNMNQMPNPQMNIFNQNQNNNQGNVINNKLQCIICNNKVNKPKKCKFCGQLYCSNCINSFTNLHDFCLNCKNKASPNDFVNASLDENMSGVGSNQRINIGKLNNQSSKNRNKSTLMPKRIPRGNNAQNFLLNNNEIQNNNQGFCTIHNNKFEYYCVQCGQYYCSNCFVFFGQEKKRHENHFILSISQMNDERIKQIVNEFKKLSESKTYMDNIIGLCNFKLKENYIKNSQFESGLNIIKESYLKKIDESFQDLDNVLNELKTQKEKIENSIGSIPNGFNNIVNTNDHVQGGIMSQELKKLNKIDPTLENNIKQMEKMQPKIFVESYHSELLEIAIPYSGQYNEGGEICNIKLDNFIPNHKSLLVMKYLQNKVYVSFAIDINLPLNAVEFPKFYCYVTIQNQKYGLDFENLLSQSFPQDNFRPNIGTRNFQQINSNEFDYGQMMFMSGNEKIIKMKIFVMKVYYKS